jgi:hypothetical protein
VTHACAVESNGTTLVNPLRFRGVDTGALPITDEAKLHLGDHSQDGQNHAAHRPTSVDGRLEHPEACSLLFQSVHEIENIPRVPA